MIKVNVFEAKAKLSEYLDQIARGERVVICRRNHPVAELIPIAAARTQPRPIGGAKSLAVPAAFFEPLPGDVIDSFYPLDTPTPARARANRVAEPPAQYRKRRGRRRKP